MFRLLPAVAAAVIINYYYPGAINKDGSLFIL
jgi:hypothetical protein